MKFARVFWITSLWIFLTPLSAGAQVFVSEIFYDAAGSDENREWIEVYNGTAADIDFSRWKFFEGKANHALKVSAGPAGNLGSYIIIADDAVQFLADNPDFSGTLYDSSFSLSNKGETIALKNEKGDIVDSVSFTPSGISGQSLQKITAGWSAAKPSPGKINTISKPPKKTTPEVKPVTPKETTAEAAPAKPAVAEIVEKLESPAAASLSQGSGRASEAEPSSLWPWIVGLTGVILVALFGLYLAEEKSVSGPDRVQASGRKELAASDFEIIEEEEK